MFKNYFLAILCLTLNACASSLARSTPTTQPPPTQVQTLAPAATETPEPTATFTVTPSPTVTPTATALPFPTYDEITKEAKENCDKIPVSNWTENYNLHGQALTGERVDMFTASGHRGKDFNYFFNFSADSNRLWCTVTGWGHGEQFEVGDNQSGIWGHWEFPVDVVYYDPDNPRAVDGFVKYYYFPPVNNSSTPSP